jgi:hypothetical protein
MDAHGGWTATPIDLARLMSRVDGFTAKADILKPATEATMNAGSTPNPGYGLGWIEDSAYRGHNGAMDGIVTSVSRWPGYDLF